MYDIYTVLIVIQASLRITMLDWLKEQIFNEIRTQFQFSQISIIERFCFRPSQFSTKNAQSLRLRLRT